MLGGVWIIVWTAKIFAKQNGDRVVEILDSAPFDADCYHVIIGNWSGAAAYLTASDRLPRADWQHKFLVTGLNPLSLPHISMCVCVCMCLCIFMCVCLSLTSSYTLDVRDPSCQKRNYIFKLETAQCCHSHENIYIIAYPIQVDLKQRRGRALCHVLI